MSSHYLERGNYLGIAPFKVGGAKYLVRNHLKHSRKAYLCSQLLQQGKSLTNIKPIPFARNAKIL